MHILFLTRHYPPEISGGARRPLLLVRGLRKLGHRVTVVTPFNQVDDDDAICIEHPVDLNIGLEPSQGAPAIKLRQKYLRDYLRQWLLWPDADIRWIRRIYRDKNLLSLKPDIIISSSPPVSIHIAANKLSQKSQIPWIADFRDTWIKSPHQLILETSKLRRFGERAIAKSTLSKANGLISVSSFVQQDVVDFFTKQTPTLVLPHFSAPATVKFTFEDKDKFHCLHSGGFSLSDRRRSLDKFLNVFLPIQAKSPTLHLHITGALSGAEKMLVAQNPSIITDHGQVPLETSIAMQAAADALILVTPKNSEALPGKFAEYSFANRPIYYQGDGNWLNLVADKSNFYPLEHLDGQQKHSKTTQPTALHADDAAQLVSQFLNEVVGCNTIP